MVWIVLPRPISSARMPFKRLLYSDTIHVRPASWYSLSWPPTSMRGCRTSSAAACVIA